MNQRPFEITRWESPKAPTPEFLNRMLERDGLSAAAIEIPPHTHSPEMKFERTVIRVLLSGRIQYSFPGYGVIELEPGDMLEIQPDILHDVIVGPDQPAHVLQAFRE